MAKQTPLEASGTLRDGPGGAAEEDLVRGHVAIKGHGGTSRASPTPVVIEINAPSLKQA